MNINQQISFELSIYLHRYSFFRTVPIKNSCISGICFALILLANSFLTLPAIAQEDKVNPSKESDNYFDSISKIGILRWPINSMPLKIYIKPGDTTNGYRPSYTPLLEQAFSEWSQASQNRIRFLLTKDPANAQIVCGWTSDKKDMTQLTEGGHALVIPDGHNIKRVEIVILTKTTSGESLSDQFFKRTALHEIGHALGITEHSHELNDMMYGAPPPSTISCTLTTRDKNTLIALYSLDQATINQTKVNYSSMLPAKDNQSNLARIIRLNAEASTAMQNKNLALAVSKLEEAHKIDPNNDLISSNLGSAYGNCAVVSCLIKDNQRAQIYFSKALSLLANGANKENYISVLKCYENYLRNNNKIAEADKISKRITALQH